MASFFAPLCCLVHVTHVSIMTKEAWLRTGLGVLAGLVGTVALAFLWHLFGGASSPKEADYVYTQYFTSCLSWRFAAAYLALGIALGWIVRRVATVALGMILP